MKNQVHYNSSHIPSLSNADPISQLPADQTQPSHNELMIVNSLFKDHGNSINIIFKEMQDAILVGILFITLSLPQIDDMIKRILPMTQNSIYILLLVKAIIVMALFWLIKHLYLSRKDS